MEELKKLLDAAPESTAIRRPIFVRSPTMVLFCCALSGGGGGRNSVCVRGRIRQDMKCGEKMTGESPSDKIEVILMIVARSRLIPGAADSNDRVMVNKTLRVLQDQRTESGRARTTRDATYSKRGLSVPLLKDGIGVQRPNLGT